MKKRMLALVFACFMLTLPLTACGGNASNSTGADAAAQKVVAGIFPETKNEQKEKSSGS